MTFSRHFSRASSYLKSDGLGPFLMKAMAGSGAVHGAGTVLSFLVGIQLARGLGVEGYGRYGIAMAVITLASVPAEFGLPRLVTREVAAARAHGDHRSIYSILRWSDRTCLLFSAFMAAVIVAGTMLVYDNPTSPVAAAILWGIPVIPLVAFTRLRGGALQGLHHVVLGQVPAILVRPLLFALLLLLLFQLEPEASAAHAMALNGATAAAALLFAAYLLRRRLPVRPSTVVPVESKRWLSSAFAFGLTSGIFILQGQIAIVVLALAASEAEVGLFRIGISTLAMVTVPMTLIATISAPLLSSFFASSDGGRLQRLATSSVRMQFAGVLLLSLPLLLAGEPIIVFVFGMEYEGAADGLRILCLGQLLSSAFGISATLLNMTGHEWRLTRALLLASVLNAALVALLGPQLGNVGAAWAYAGSLALWNLIAWLDAKRLVRVNTILR